LPLNLLGTLFLLCFCSLAAVAQPHWPQWRGPLGTGAAPQADPPLIWSETQNIRWKKAVPGRGHSTPIVWGDRVFLTAAVPYGEKQAPQPDRSPGSHDNLAVDQHHRFVALAYDRHDGTLLWQRTLHQALPHEGGHYSGSLASASPVTDGKRLYVFFGSYGLYCLTLDGEMLWSKNLGRMQTKHGHGEGASPALADSTLIVNWDHSGQSFIVAFDSRSGAERWRLDRDEVTSWSTPIIVQHKGTQQLIVNGTSRLRGYDIKSGTTIWECAGLSANVVASPVAGDGMVFAASSYDTRALLAIRLDGAQGDITGTDHVAWTRRRGTPYVPSPLLYDGMLYFLRHYQGVLTRLEARSGAEPSGPFRLEGIRNVYASPIGAAGRLYITSLDGATLVMSNAETPQLLGLNILDDRFNASAAAVGDALFLRGERFLYCIAREDGTADKTAAEITN
jgi:outer membrane protein assembly factor BamB